MLTLAAGACRDTKPHGDGSVDRPYINALAETFVDDKTLPVNVKDALCLSERFVEALGGGAKLRADKVSPEEVAKVDDPTTLVAPAAAEDLRTRLGGSFLGCGVDLAALHVAVLKQSFVVTVDAADCVRRHMNTEAFAYALGAEIGRNGRARTTPELAAAIRNLNVDCPALTRLAPAKKTK